MTFRIGGFLVLQKLYHKVPLSKFCIYSPLSFHAKGKKLLKFVGFIVGNNEPEF